MTYIASSVEVVSPASLSDAAFSTKYVTDGASDSTAIEPKTDDGSTVCYGGSEDKEENDMMVVIRARWS